VFGNEYTIVILRRKALLQCVAIESQADGGDVRIEILHRRHVRQTVVRVVEFGIERVVAVAEWKAIHIRQQ
jgi:hypothetical protein